MPLPNEKTHYTYADYLQWDDGERWELIDGVAYAMSPAASWTHQGIGMELIGQFYTFLKGKKCRVFPAPFDVRLNASAGDDTVLQPDIVIICDPSILSGTGCKGVPDMVVEILSPSTQRRDRLDKLQQYQKAGVREYWIVDPESKMVSAYLLENGKYSFTAYSDTDTAPVNILEGCEINLPDVFSVIP